MVWLGGSLAAPATICEFGGVAEVPVSHPHLREGRGQRKRVSYLYETMVWLGGSLAAPCHYM